MALTPAQSTRKPAGALAAVLVAAVVVGLAGCRGDAAREMIAANNDTNVKRLGTLYGFFQLRNEFRGPRDEDELRAFINAQDPARLALAGISPAAIDGLFTSERDRLPFRIRYGIDTRVRGPALPVVFEQTGRDGRRQVGFTGGTVDEVDAATYESLWSGASERQTPADSSRENRSPT
jgi:hypothetical protein